MNIPAITVNIDTTEAIAALDELEAAINRVETALNNLTVSPMYSPASYRREVSVDELAERVNDDPQSSFWIVDTTSSGNRASVKVK